MIESTAPDKEAKLGIENQALLQHYGQKGS